MSLPSDSFPEDVRLAHDKSSHHRDEVMESALCGCFYCCRTFAPSEIKEWIDEKRTAKAGQTALCPHCGIDAVIGDKSGVALTPEFLQRMNSFWFSVSGSFEKELTDDELSELLRQGSKGAARRQALDEGRPPPIETYDDTDDED